MFDINCLTLENSSNNQLQTISGFSENCFTETLKYSLESQTNMIEINKQLYRSLLESGTDVVMVNEGFSDFTSKMVILLDNFLKFIKKLWDKFIRAISSLSKSDSYLLKHKSDIDKFNSDCQFTYEDYVYTIGQEGKIVPIVDIKPTFQIDMMYIDSSIMDDSKNNEEKLKCIKSKYDEIKQKLDNDYFDSVRATIIGKTGGKISANQYAKELFKVFRNDSDDKTIITIKDSNVQAAYQFVTDYKNALKSVEETQRDIISQYTDIKNYIQGLLKIDKNNDANKVSIGFDDNVNGKSGTSFSLDSETLKYLNLFIKAKSEQVQQFSNIHSQAFGAKLQAFKDCYQSSKNICYQAINAVNKLHLNESTEDILEESSLSSKQRKNLDEDVFGIPSLRKYPLNNKQHVSSAITYFNKVEPKYEAELARNIKKRIKELHMSPEVSSSNKFSKYYKSSKNECTLKFV